MAADTLIELKNEWHFSRQFMPEDVKEHCDCVVIAEEPHIRQDVMELLNLTSKVEFLAEAACLEELQYKLETGIPELAVVSVNIMGKNTINTIAQLKKQFPGIAILVIATYNAPTVIQRIFMAGANGYLLQNTLFQQLGEAFLAIVAGKVYLHNALFSLLIGSIFIPENNPGTNDDNIIQLSDKEFEIFVLAGRGFSYDEIAQFTGFAISSVMAYIKNIRIHFGFGRTCLLIEYATKWVIKNLLQ